MRITSIKLMKRKNLGNYEHEEVSVEAVIGEGETVEKAFVDLSNFVDSALNGTLGSKEAIHTKTEKIVQTEENKAVLKAATEQALSSGKEEKPKSAPRRSQAKTIESTEEKTEVVTASAVEWEDVKSPYAADKNVEGQDIPPVIPQELAPKTEKAPAASLKVAADKAPKTNKVVLYDSKVKEHRSRFATYLGNNFPKWTPDAKFGKDTNSVEKTAYAEKVKAFSATLHDKPFEDLKGNMLDTFKNDLKAFFG